MRLNKRASLFLCGYPEGVGVDPVVVRDGVQLGFSDYELTTTKQQTKLEKLLAQMNPVVPWQALIDLIDPHCPKASKKGGRLPQALATQPQASAQQLLRIHLLQHQWYAFSDPMLKEALIDEPTCPVLPASS